MENSGTPIYMRILEAIALVAGISYAIVTWCMWRDTNHNFTVDERAWVGVPVNIDPLKGIAANQITNSGKTPAKGVEGDVIATVLNKGDDAAIGDFSAGHPTNPVHLPVIFPNTAIPANFTMSKYGHGAPEPIVFDEEMVQSISNKNRYGIFYGRLKYSDAFGVEHWTQFCAATQIIQKCFDYNDVDKNEK